MEKKIKIIKQILLKSINNYSIYKKYFQEIYLIMKENKKYEKSILKYYNLENEEKYFKIIFLLFFQNHIWINPNDINIYAFQEHFKLKLNKIDDKAEQSIIMNFDSDKIMKIFVYWYIYLLVKLSKVFEEKNNTINNNMNANEFLYEIKNIFMQTNNKILNIYKAKKINIEELYSFLYIYLYFIEHNTKSILFEKQLKILNKIIFLLLFDLFQKISIITVTQKDINDQNRNNIKLFYSFLSELKENELINNDYNIIILLENNIITNFIDNILMNINPKIFITKSDIPSSEIRNEISEKLAEFYFTFVKFHFNKGKVMDFLINNVKNGLINLRYFKEEKEQILKDALIQNFQSELIKKIVLQESNKRAHPNFDSFLFNGNNSKMSFKLGKYDLNDNMIIFSFKMKPNFNRNNSYNDRQTLISLYNYKNDLIFKLILKKDDSVNIKSNKENIINKTNNKKDKFVLSISSNNKEEIELNELDKIETNLIYFICIHFNTNIPYLHTYLSSSGNNSKILKSYGEIKMSNKEEDIILNIGYDLMGKEKDYFSGYIGNFYIIKLYNIKNKIDYDNNKIFIESILQLKEFYRYFIYYFNNNTEFNLDYINYFKNKEEIYILKEFQNIKNNTKNLYEANLFLLPELFKFLNINEKDNINNYRLPLISRICEKQKLYSFNDINVSIVKYENSREVFLRKNGLDYFCLQFEYFFQLANYYILFMNQHHEKQNQDQEKVNNNIEIKEIKTNEIIEMKAKEEKIKINETKGNIEITTVLEFYQENIELIIDLIKSSINNVLLLLTQYIANLKIMNFSVNLKKIFATLLSAMKSLNNIRSIISSTFYPLNGIIILISEQIQERYFKIKNKTSSDYTIKFLTSFRDGLIVDFLLFNEFYISHTKVLNTQFLGMLFDKMISIIESNDMVDITVSYNKIFLKVLSFTSIISDLFLNYDVNLDKNNLKSSRGGNSILNNYLKLIKGLIIRKKNISNEDIFFKQLIEFSLLDYRHNQYISYAFLNIINDLLKDRFSLDEKEILNLINYLIEIINNKEHNLDLAAENEDVKKSQTNPEKITKNLSSLILSILLDTILKKKNKKYFNNFCNGIRQIELNDQMFSLIINNLYQIITENFSYETSSIKNNKSSNKNSKNKSTSKVPKIDEIDFRSFYEDLFDLILILFKKKFEKNENESINNENGNNEKENIINKDIRNKPDEVKLNLINLVVFIEEMINGYINNKNTFQIGVLYCFLNLIKLFHIITFDEKLICIYLEEKFLVLFKIILELLIKSKILFTNFFINPNEKPSSVSKTISETIIDICIKLITSDIIQDEKNDNLKKELILTKGNIIDFLKEAYLLEKFYKKNKIEGNKKRTLFCFNDIFRKIFSGKISNAENEIIKFNKNKNLVKYFPKLDNDFVILFYINDLLENREKKFNYNFITFNLDKIYKYKFNLESSNQNLKDFLETLLTRLINEHQILYNFDKDFFFKSNSNYSQYNLVKTKIETTLSKKTFDEASISKFLEDHFSIKVEVSEFVTSDLCEDIKEKRKRKKSETSKTSKINSVLKFERKNSINSLNETKKEYLNISPGTIKIVPNSVNLYDKEINKNINNSLSRTNSITSSSLDLETSSQNDEISSHSEDSNNLNSAENILNNINKISQEKSVSSRDTSNYSLTKSALPPNHNIDGESSNSNNNYKSIQKKSLLEEVNENCYFNILDNLYVINAKNEYMKNIFSIYFLDTFFYDKTFIELKKLYNQIYEEKLVLEMNKNININYPSKIKNFSNGIEPPLFIKPFNNFFDYKTTLISHQFFFDFIREKNKKYKYQYINLFKKQVIIPEKDKTCQFTCELIKIDHSIYGTIILSNNSEYLFFEQENFENIYNQNKNKVDYDGLFSLSCIKMKERENDNINKKNYQSRNSIPKNKMILILVSEIEEIIERRFLLMWQGFEVYLKDGRSYFFNFFRQSKFDKFKKQISKNNELYRLFHKKDYLTKEKSITKAWEDNILTTYEYLLFINKYASRSFNDANQYYIFPWILSKFQNLLNINQKDIINEDQRKLSISSNNSKSKDKEIKDVKEDELSKSLRDLKYPISLQTIDNRKLAIYRYNDDEESKFRFHLGTHYSTAPFIFYYLMRQEPYNTLLIKLQNYQQENPNRMFIGILETSDVLKGGNDNRELIPEFFSKIEFFLNLNCSFFGLRTNDVLVNNVHIGFMKNKCESQILVSDYVRLIYEHKKLINSNLISSNINDWINNVFGTGQLPNIKIRKNCCNIFRKTTYEKETSLIKKVEHYKSLLNKKYDSKTIRYKIMNKINLIISFGQTPYQVFKEDHPKRIINPKNIKRENNNLGYNNNYEAKDDNSDDDDDMDILEKFSNRILRPSFNQSKVQFDCIYFELNIINNRIFGLTQNEDVVEINFNIKDGNDNISTLSLINNYKIPHIKFFEKIKLKQSGIDYYIYKPKYAFCSFKEEDEYNSPSRKGSYISGGSNSSFINSKGNKYNFNTYYKKLLEDFTKVDNDNKKNEENFKFMQCRYLDNSFKLYNITKIKNPKKKEKEIIINSYSYICEDFVASCCPISSDQFVVGLENGKLIRWNIYDLQKNRIKLNFDKNIQAHRSRINAIEIDKRLGLIITCGNDNFIQIRKLYNLELITPIKISQKYIVTMAKVSPINLIYAICFDKTEKKSFILGYTLSGIKFAKSQVGYYCNIDFTRNGNIVSLLNNKEICILNAYDLKRKDIKAESGLNEFKNIEKQVEGSVWMEYKYLFKKTYNTDGTKINNIIVYMKHGKRPEDCMIFYYDFKGNTIFD